MHETADGAREGTVTGRIILRGSHGSASAQSTRTEGGGRRGTSVDAKRAVAAAFRVQFSAAGWPAITWIRDFRSDKILATAYEDGGISIER